MYELRDVLKKYKIIPKSYEKRGKAIIVTTSDSKYVINNKKNNNEIFDYLKSRNFDYYPKKLNSNSDNFEIVEYIDDINIPKEQKIIDMINLLALLHNKTTYYKEVDINDFDKTYDDIKNNIDYLLNYYNDIITIIESKIIYSPSQLLFARNYTAIIDTLVFENNLLDKWYELVKEKRKRRYVVIHNNLDIDHFLNKNFISWDKSRIDLPIYDLYKLYKKYCLDYDFEFAIKKYESLYPLLDEERKLFHILILLPDKLEFNLPEYEMCVKISEMIDYIYKTKQFISPYYFEESKTD